MADQPRTNGGRQPTVYELLKEIDKRYEVQFEAQTDALAAADKRYEQRFIAQETAVSAALVNQDKAVTAALAAAKEAVTKAELAAEKRFDQFAVSLTEKLDGLLSSRDQDAGKGAGINAAWAGLLAVATLIGVIATVVYTMHAVTGR